MTRNPYAPPKSSVQKTSERAPAPRGAIRFWVAFYLSPTGRTSRLFYLLFGLLPLSLFGFVLGLFLHTPNIQRDFLIATIILVWPQASIIARRFHDINMTGWLVAVLWALPIAPTFLDTPIPPRAANIAGWLGTLALGFIPGTRGPNRYGKDPLDNSRMSAGADSV